jgi:hypothetical protein
MRRIANQIIHIVQTVQTITDNKIQRASFEFRKTLPQYPSDNLLVSKKHLGNTVLRGVLSENVMYVIVFGHILPSLKAKVFLGHVI